MKNDGCYCSAYCCRCEKKNTPLYRCRGCSHHFCFCCSFRLGEGVLCRSCMTVWLNAMSSFDLPSEVVRWFNQVTL